MKALVFTLLCLGLAARAGIYAPAAGQPGTTAIAADDSRIIAWGSATGTIVRGPYEIGDPDSPLVSFGNPGAVLGPANAFDIDTGEPSITPSTVLSLGDGGSIVVTFAQPIANGPSWDFAVFENGFNDTFLELAFVEVSSDGATFFRFPNHSLTQTADQIDQNTALNAINPRDIDGFAGKYRVGFGTPFDLSLLAGRSGLDINAITAVRLVDVVGSIDPLYARRDTELRIINDPWPTPFNTGGFDLDAIGVLHTVPEPGVAALFAAGLLGAVRRRRS